MLDARLTARLRAMAQRDKATWTLVSAVASSGNKYFCSEDRQSERYSVQCSACMLVLSSSNPYMHAWWHILELFCEHEALLCFSTLHLAQPHELSTVSFTPYHNLISEQWAGGSSSSHHSDRPGNQHMNDFACIYSTTRQHSPQDYQT